MNVSFSFYKSFLTQLPFSVFWILLPIGLTACSEANVNFQTPEPTGSTAPLAREDKATPSVTPEMAPLLAAAKDRLKALVVYDGRYIGMAYPGGDVPATMGVCTDVVIRSYRAAYGFDLQTAVHEDMVENFNTYPTNWGHTRTDRNIDHRRVPNLETWFTRAGYSVSITGRPSDYAPGDIVSWRLDGLSGAGGLPHIGIVSDRTSNNGTPLIIHNIGRGPEESDMLFSHKITGHFRFLPESAL